MSTERMDGRELDEPDEPDESELNETEPDEPELLEPEDIGELDGAEGVDDIDDIDDVDDTAGLQDERQDDRRDDRRHDAVEPATTDGFRERWTQIQVDFVDAPRRSVEQADALLTEAIDDLVARLGQRHDELEARWRPSEGASTEYLRTTLQDYRAFLDRLQAV